MHPTKHWSPHARFCKTHDENAVPEAAALSAAEAGEFKRRSITGVAQAMTGRVFQVVLNFGSIAVLARLLSPKDFGIVATVSAVTALLSVFRDAGLTMSALRSKDLTPQQSTNLFWMTLVLSGLVAIAIASLAPVMAKVYRMPEVAQVMRALAFASILEGMGMQHGALLRREMRLGAYTAATVISEVVAVSVALAVALLGWGYWALVAKSLVAAAVSSALLWWFCDFRPGRPRRGSGVTPMIMFGARLTLAQVLWVVLRKADDALIGWAWGPTALGYYSRAYTLLMLPTQQLTQPLATAAIPTLSRLQNEPERFRSYYLRGIEFVTFLGFPLVVLLFVTAGDFVSFVFGAQWLPSVPIFRALGAATLIEITMAAGYWILVPLGRSDKELKMAAIYVPLLVGGILCGLPWGPIGVALGISAVRVLAQPFNLRYCYRDSPVSLKQYYIAIWEPLAAACLSGAIVWMLSARYFAQLPTSFARLMASGVAMGLLYLGIFMLLPDGRNKLQGLVQAFRDLVASRGKATPPAA
jgi:O-antigen/teichoic acid export membrane protein